MCPFTDSVLVCNPIFSTSATTCSDISILSCVVGFRIIYSQQCFQSIFVVVEQQLVFQFHFELEFEVIAVVAAYCCYAAIVTASVTAAAVTGERNAVYDTVAVPCNSCDCAATALAEGNCCSSRSSAVARRRRLNVSLVDQSKSHKCFTT
uniref:Uncharacterized protein n=1 Tax=Onchocerca volvulus TaxID=6282 RepID=A0A8R1TMC9_ONCVO